MIFILFIFFVVFVYSTGIEIAKIEIVPISINNNNDILFKTHVDIDPQDAGATRLEKYGFLIINRNGLWEEYFYFSEEIKDEKDWDEILRIDENYKNNDFNHIDLYNNIILEYQFLEIKNDYILEENRTNLINHDERFMDRGYNTNLKVRTLEGFSSYLPSSEVLLYYKYESIYLIRNRKDYFSYESTGADFILPNYWITTEQRVDNLDYAKNIDGIVICNE